MLANNAEKIEKRKVEKIKKFLFFRRWILSETACKANAFGMTYLGEIDMKGKHKNAKYKKYSSMKIYFG